MGVFTDDEVDLWVKDFEYTYCNMITNSSTLYCNGICVKMIGSAASGGWENYHVPGEHVSITNLYLNNLIKMLSLNLFAN
jgi:hypothetical protein